jgi:hypothetical protein
VPTLQPLVQFDSEGGDLVWFPGVVVELTLEFGEVLVDLYQFTGHSSHRHGVTS